MLESIIIHIRSVKACLEGLAAHCKKFCQPGTVCHFIVPTFDTVHTTCHFVGVSILNIRGLHTYYNFDVLWLHPLEEISPVTTRGGYRI